MKSRGMIAAVLTLAAALLIGSPAPGQDPELEKQDLKARMRSLEGQLSELRSRLTLNEEVTRDQRREMVERLDRIDSQLTRLRADLRSRQSFSIDPERPLRGSSTVRVRNDMGVRAVLLFNGVEYDLDPGEARSFSHRSGTFPYYVWAEGYRWTARRQAGLEPNRRWDLRIFEP